MLSLVALLILASPLAEAESWRDAPIISPPPLQEPAPAKGERGGKEQDKAKERQPFSESNQAPAPIAQPAVNIAPTYNTHGVTTNEAEHEEKESPNYWDILIAIATVALALITFFLARYTAKLWGATDKLVADGKKSSERQLRAYISCDLGDITPCEGSNIPAIQEITVKNHGQTPAYYVRMESGMGVSTFPKARPFKLSKEDAPDTGATLHPGQPMNFAIGIDRPIADAADLESHAYAFYIFGRIDYIDAFGEDRWTTFVFFNNHLSDQIGKVWVNYSHGNDADNEGKKPPF